MIFFAKRPHSNEYSTAREACISITGLVLGSGIVCGLGALIFGLVSGRSSGTIGGAIVLGVSVFFTFIFILVIVCCWKNNDTIANTDQELPPLSHRPHHDHRKRTKSPQHITTVTAVQKFDHRTNSNSQIYAPTTSIELVDSTGHNMSKQLTPSPSKKATFDILNHSSSSVSNHHRY